MSFNRNIPVLIAATVGVMSGYYIWEPMFKTYQRESKGTWDYKVVQETRAAEMKNTADATAAAIAGGPAASQPVSDATAGSSAKESSQSVPTTATLISTDMESKYAVTAPSA